MQAVYKVPLVLMPQPEGGFTVTCPLVPELVTEGETVKEALANASDALAAVIEAFENLGKPLPAALLPAPAGVPLWLETAVALG